MEKNEDKLSVINQIMKDIEEVASNYDMCNSCTLLCVERFKPTGQRECKFLEKRKSSNSEEQKGNEEQKGEVLIYKDRRIKMIFQAYNKKIKMRKLAEEMYELIEALQEYYTHPTQENRKHVIEESADMIIMISQFQNDIEMEESEFNSFVEYKIMRQMQRINEKFKRTSK